MSQRPRTTFASILQNVPEEQPAAEPAAVAAEPPPAPASASASKAAKRNKAVDPAYTKLTAYIPRTLAAAIKMAMALETTTDQSDFIERALADWLTTTGRTDLLKQSGYSVAVSPHSDSRVDLRVPRRPTL